MIHTHSNWKLMEIKHKQPTLASTQNQVVQPKLDLVTRFLQLNMCRRIKQWSKGFRPVASKGSSGGWFAPEDKWGLRKKQAEQKRTRKNHCTDGGPNWSRPERWQI
jgi:hypothetical protein